MERNGTNYVMIRQSVIVEFITDYLQGFINWNIGEETDHIKANESIWRLEVNRLQQLYEMG
jgi:hypothetical protein